jgi:3-hydroxymyristoyl/3-hydroxydecanoyl-(acyl carrier protein) dehydratase
VAAGHASAGPLATGQPLSTWLLAPGETQAGDCLVCHQTIPPDGDILSRHLPGVPLWPGALLLEAMVQTATRWLERCGGLPDGCEPQVRLADCRLLQPVGPAATLRFETRLLREGRARARFGVRVLDSAGGLVARARIAVRVVTAAAVAPRAEPTRPVERAPAAAPAGARRPHDRAPR